MATNSRRLCLFLAVFLFINLSFVYAQSAGYFIDTEDGEPRFIQRLVWSGGEYALRYEVVIEKDDGGTYRNFHSEFTTALYIDISLQPGSYRFRVTPYDVLNRPGSASEWKYIEVLPALQPELFAVVPEYAGGSEEEASGYILHLAVNNVDPEAEIFIRSIDGTVQLHSTRTASETPDLDDVNNIMVFVERDLLISGEYDVLIRNPGGLEASIGGVSLLLPETETIVEIEETVEAEEVVEAEPEIEAEEIPESEDERFKPLKSVIFNVGLAFIPSFPIYGNVADGGISLYGLTLRTNLLFYLPIGVYIGPELSAIAYLGNYPDKDGSYTVDNLSFENFSDRFTLTAGVNLLVRKWFPNERAAFSFRAGADYGFLPDFIEQQINVRMDVSFLWRFTNNMLLEIGLDYSHIILSEELSGAFFRPWLGLSVQF